VRWDRVGHIAMVFVLGALLYLYLSAGIRILSTWQQERRDNVAVARMQREHRLLVREHEALSRQGTLEVEARGLNMMDKGEQPYVVTGLPND
jgi:hypothetical protein